MNAKKIDWVNHLIAFGASVVGIFIAFQLDDWQERRARRDEIAVTLDAIKAEIDGNLSIFHKNDSTLQTFVDYADFYFAHQQGNGLLLTRKELENALAKFPDRMNDIKLIKRVNDTVALYSLMLNVAAAPLTGISTGNWEAARASGILTHLDHERTVLLTQIYEWTERDLGYSDDTLYRDILGFKDFDDLEVIVDHYRMIAKVSRMRRLNIIKYYDQINW